MWTVKSGFSFIKESPLSFSSPFSAISSKLSPIFGKLTYGWYRYFLASWFTSQLSNEFQVSRLQWSLHQLEKRTQSIQFVEHLSKNNPLQRIEMQLGSKYSVSGNLCPCVCSKTRRKSVGKRVKGEARFSRGGDERRWRWHWKRAIEFELALNA